MRPVDPLHSKIANGIRFNVETVIPGSAKDLPQQNPWARQSIADVAKIFYDESTLKIQMEVHTFDREQTVKDTGSLMDTALMAFAYHYPLVMKPDDIWCLISYAFATHLDKNAEELRSRFVAHQGKKVLEVRVDHFTLGGMTPEDWERDVFPDFSRQIRNYIGDEKHDIIASPFSTTTPTTKATHEITLMAAMKNYFSYKVSLRRLFFNFKHFFNVDVDMCMCFFLFFFPKTNR